MLPILLLEHQFLHQLLCQLVCRKHAFFLSLNKPSYACFLRGINGEALHLDYLGLRGLLWLLALALVLVFSSASLAFSGRSRATAIGGVGCVLCILHECCHRYFVEACNLRECGQVWLLLSSLKETQGLPTHANTLGRLSHGQSRLSPENSQVAGQQSVHHVFLPLRNDSYICRAHCH